MKQLVGSFPISQLTLGLPLGLEAPVMMPNSVIFLFFYTA